MVKKILFLSLMFFMGFVATLRRLLWKDRLQMENRENPFFLEPLPFTKVTSW
jgi:hypothetical protein